MKICYLFFITLLLLNVKEASAQSEFSIEDIDNDGDATIEIIKNESAEHHLRRMLLGVNQSSEGFLRMVSNHDLSFWTNNKRRITIDNNGSVGMGIAEPMARLHVGSGDIIAQTKLRIVGNLGLHEARLSFFTDDIRHGGILSRGNSIIVEHQDKGNIILRSNGNDQLIANPNGQIRIPGYSGDEVRNLTVDQNGNIGSASFDEDDIHMLIPITQFQAMFGLQLENFFGLRVWAPPSIFHMNLDGLHMVPMFHHTKVLVKELTISYIDEDDDEDLIFRIRRPNGEPNLEQSSSGFSSSSQSITFQLNIEIDQSVGDEIQLVVFHATKMERSILGAKIVYQKL